MKRELTQREKVLLLILTAILLACCYVKLFSEPLQTRLITAQERLAAAQDTVLVEQMKAAQMEKMQKELESLKTSGSERTEIPDYNNLDSVMMQLDSILSRAQDYDLTFQDLQFGDKLISRPVEMTFTAASYPAAREILNALHDCWYRCVLSNLSVTAQEGSVAVQPVTVTVTATFFEKYDDAAAADDPANTLQTDAAEGTSTK